MGVKPLIVSLTDAASGESFVAAFAAGPIHLGRGDDSTLQIDRDQVSAHHAMIVFDDDRVLFTDCDSLHGSTIDGVMPRIGEQVPITEASEVRIGRVTLSFSRRASSVSQPVDARSKNPFAAVRPNRIGTEILAVPSQPAKVVPHHPGALPSGTLLGGRFKILELVGRGGMGAVYRAHDENLNAAVAIKTLSHAREMTPDLLERFFREAKVIRAVSHPNIVVVHDVGMDNGIPYIAMELLKGEDLGAAIDRAPLALTEAVDIMLGVCAGLHAAHERGLVHRDLKPQNIFLSQAWRVQDVPKILDFGISKTSDSKLTNTGDIMGTEHYLSPEQAQDSNAVDARSDIYALGVILYQCVTQKPPHDGGNMYLVIKNIVEGNVRPLRQVRPDVPQGFADTVQRAMALHPADRFASAHDLARALLPFASSRGQRLWSDHFSSLPPLDPQASLPHRIPFSPDDSSSPGAQPPARVAAAGGTRHLGPTPPVGPDRGIQARRPRRTANTTLFAVAVAVVVVVAGAVALVDGRGQSTPALVTPAPSPPSPAPPGSTPEATTQPVAPLQPDLGANLHPDAGANAGSAKTPSHRSKRKRVRYNADGIPLVQ
jgi:serine/threonine-protein kinase